MSFLGGFSETQEGLVARAGHAFPNHSRVLVDAPTYGVRANLSRTRNRPFFVSESTILVLTQALALFYKNSCGRGTDRRTRAA